MGIRINTNILALKAQNRLDDTSVRFKTSLTRLSSGLRINTGSEDVVGLMKSESLRSQIRGISTAELNIATASSALGVAEGSLAQLTDVAQRMREIVLQASDESISSSDRDNLNNSLADLKSEFSRLTAASEFDGVKLLNGTFTGRAFQVGPNAGDQISVSLSDTRMANIGKVAVMTSEVLTNNSGGTNDMAIESDDMGVVIMNGIILDTSLLQDDGVSTHEAEESAIATVNWINSYTGQTGITARLGENVMTWNYTIAQADGLSASVQMNINGVNIAQASYAADDAGATAFAEAVNNISLQTGVTAEVDLENNNILLNASDGRNIFITLSGLDNTDNNYIFGSAEFTNASQGSMIQVGPFIMYSDEGFTVTDDGDGSFSGLNDSTSLNNLDISTADDAEEGLWILDNVIRQLQVRRSDVGSKVNRLGVAESELQSRKENIASSESRIRDVDVAQETASLTGSEILQQAGAQVLTRANTLSQIALSLLAIRESS